MKTDRFISSTHHLSHLEAHHKQINEPCDVIDIHKNYSIRLLETTEFGDKGEIIEIVGKEALNLIFNKKGVVENG